MTVVPFPPRLRAVPPSPTILAPTVPAAGDRARKAEYSAVVPPAAAARARLVVEIDAAALRYLLAEAAMRGLPPGALAAAALAEIARCRMLPAVLSDEG